MSQANKLCFAVDAQQKMIEACRLVKQGNFHWHITLLLPMCKWIYFEDNVRVTILCQWVAPCIRLSCPNLTIGTGDALHQWAVSTVPYSRWLFARHMWEVRIQEQVWEQDPRQKSCAKSAPAFSPPYSCSILSYREYMRENQCKGHVWTKLDQVLDRSLECRSHCRPAYHN